MIKKQFLKFLVVGCANTGLGLIVYWILNVFIDYQLAYALAYIAGIVFSYVLNAKWVFNANLHWKTFVIFPLVYVVQLLLNMFLLHIFVERFGWSETWAPIVVIILSIPVTFLLSKFILEPVKARGVAEHV